jgi:hypothetical protein
VGKNDKKYCSKHYNSCPQKRKNFSENIDHKTYSAKSLKTRIEKGITKTSQVKAAKTRIKNGHYEKLSEVMKKRWEESPWNNKPNWRTFKSTGIQIQSTNEYNFLESLEKEYGLEWVENNVKRGPCFYYNDPISLKNRLYISDFIIDNTIYEIKGDYTWNKKGSDINLQNTNEAKLDAASEVYNVVLILEGVAIKWIKTKNNFCG